MSTTSPIEHSQIVALGDIPARALAWVRYDRSVTDIAARLTGQTVHVAELCQEVAGCPSWVTKACRAGARAFVRHIELRAGDRRILVARTFAHPDGDVVARLRELGDAPLANLLFENPSNRRSTPQCVRAEDWYGRAVQWHISGCADPILLMEIFDPDFTRVYAPTQAEDFA